jgi:hypothetical protein
MSGGFGKHGTSVTALRAQMRDAAQKGSPPPPPKKNKGAQLEDIRDQAAEKAERMSMKQHQTSLLTKAPKNSRAKAVQERKAGIPLVFQVLLVLLAVGGGALALDPNLMAHVQPYIDQIQPHIDTVREQAGL